MLPTILEMPEMQALVKLSMDGMGWYAWVQSCIKASLLDSREKQMQELMTLKSRGYES